MATGFVWTCDACGKRETWRKGWCHYDPVPSVANPGRVWVMCSDACHDETMRRWSRGEYPRVDDDGEERAG